MNNWKLASVILLAAACGGGDGNNPDGGVNPPVPDAPVNAPVITSFVASPAQVQAGVPTDVTWTWTYQAIPTLPEPTCTINNGVGPVTSGQTTSVTLTSVTTFLLTCTNSAGTGSRQVVIGLPPSAPVIATFTATPSVVTPNAATNITWAWTYTGSPSPAPTCTIEHGVGTVTTGMTTSVTQPQARIYRLRCTNGIGTATSDVAVTVDECAANIDDCGPNTVCTDTADSFSCACATGFTGNGDTCSSLQSCFVTPSLCDADATCTSTTAGPACVCDAGFIGSGTPGDCQPARVAFVTSTAGTGNLSLWTGAGGMTGLAAADAVCQARATAAGLTGTFVAWMSDSTSDAYCRVHGLTGKKSAMCGQGTLPVTAGPWIRAGATLAPFAPRIDRLLAPNLVVYQPASATEFGSEVSSSDRVYTATDANGAYISAACNDWTSSSSVVTASHGEAHGGGTTWTDTGATELACSTSARLRCMQVAPGSGPALPSRHAPIGATASKRIFVTSVSGTGNLSSWDDATGFSGLAAGDAICQARARYAGYSAAANFKAWLSTTTYAYSRITSNGPWVRPDGVVVATSENDLEDGLLKSAINQTETNAYLAGNADDGSTWTGTSQYGSYTGYYCSTWSSTTSTGTTGRHDLLDARWTTATTTSCSATQRLVCLED